MTKPTKAGAEGPRFDPTRRYEVQLSRVVEWPPGSGRFLSPGRRTELRGDVAARLADDISAETLLPEPAQGS